MSSPHTAPEPDRRGARRRRTAAASAATRVEEPGRTLQARNAPMLRAVLLLTGVFQPLMLLYALAGPQAASMDRLGIALAMANTVFVWICFLVVMRGHTRLAASLFVAGTLALLTFAYLRWGLRLQLPHQATQVIPVLVCGLLLHRRALWMAVGWLALIVVLGGWRDAARDFFHPDAVHLALGGMLGSVFTFFLIAVVLDRAVGALRDSLDMALRRSGELARSRDRLELEIAEKERSQAQLVHAQKIEVVGRIASSLAHDFNHLLALVLGYAGNGRQAATLDEARQALVGVESAGRRAAAASRKLMGFARHDIAHVEQVDVVAALAEMEPMLRQLFHTRAHVVLELPTVPVIVNIDRSQFEQVVLNLATNADHAMPGGGRFTLTACPDAEGHEIELLFSDTGHGVPEALRTRIFEPFFTTRPKGVGTGLGLAVAFDLVHGWGGRLELMDSTGRGTTFRLVLPVAAAV